MRRAVVPVLALAALVVALMAAGPAVQAAKPTTTTTPTTAPPPAGLHGYEVVTMQYTLVGQTSDFEYHPVYGVQATRTIDCPAGKVPLSGGGKVTSPTFSVPEYTDDPVMVVADSRPTATGWSVTWVAGNTNAVSGGVSYRADLSAVCAFPA